MAFRAMTARVGAALGILVLVVAVGLGVVLAMETNDDDDRPIAQDDEESTAEEQDQGQDGDEDEEGGPGDGDLIATTEGNGVRIDVLSLERTSDEVVTLEFRLTNVIDDDVVVELGEGTLDFTAGAVYLHDEPNGKKYLSLRDTEGGCLCSSVEVSYDLEPGGELDLYVKFPAPPEDVTTVSIGVPTFGTVDNVEIGG